MHERKKVRFTAVICSLFFGALLLTACRKGPEAGTVYGPSDSEENLYLNLTADEAKRLEEEEKVLPEAEIIDSGYTITEIDESDVYPPKKTDDSGNAMPAYLVDFAVRISNEDNDRAMIWPTVKVTAVDSNGNVITEQEKKIRTYVLPGDVIAFGSDITVRGEKPSRIRFTAYSEDPETFYPAEEELNIPFSDSYQTGEVTVRVAEEFEEDAPSAGRKSSDGLPDGYFYFKELPELSGTISCTSGNDQEAYVTILYRDGDEILGGETSRVMIPAGKTASYVFTAAAPIPEDTQSYEATAFSIAAY